MRAGTVGPEPSILLQGVLEEILLQRLPLLCGCDLFPTSLKVVGVAGLSAGAVEVVVSEVRA